MTQQPPYDVNPSAVNPPGAQSWNPAQRPAVPGQWGPPGYRPMPGPGGFPSPPPPPTSPAGQPLATFLDRFLAYLVDSAVFFGVTLVLTIPAFIIFFAVVGPDLVQVNEYGSVIPPNFSDFFMPLLLMELGIAVVVMILLYVYYVEMMFRTGQTLGKKVMKLRVVPIDPAGTLNRGIAARRYLVQFLAGGFVPGLSYLDGLWQLWDKPYQQCLHDKFAKTVVVKVPG